MSNVSQLATPHLRSVTAVLPQQSTPTATTLPPYQFAPSVQFGQFGQLAATAGVLRLPEGALIAPWPLGGGAELQLAGGDVPMVGYLVLVPAEGAQSLATVTQLPVTQPPVAQLPVAGTTGAVPGWAEQAATAAASVAAPEAVSEPASLSGIQLDLERRSARVDGRPLDLTYLEFELLAHLTANPHRVHTRDHLVTAVWGYGHVGDGRTVDVHVARLRRKLGSGYRPAIVTVRRVGYKYVPPKNG